MAQLVARDVWDVDAAGSNPVTPTKDAVLTARKPQGSNTLRLSFSSIGGMIMPVIEYSFMPHYYIATKDIYESYICDCINKCENFNKLVGGNFQKITSQCSGQPDAISNETSYSIDFKLMISNSLAEFRNISRSRVYEPVPGMKIFCPGKKTKQNVVLMPNACRNIDKDQLAQHRTSTDPISKAVVYFFDKVINTPKNILIFLPLFISTVDKSIPLEQRIDLSKTEFSDTLKYIFEYRNEHHSAHDTYFMYIINDEKNRKFYFVLCEFTSSGLTILDIIDMFSIPSVVFLAQKNMM